ncbi:helix-turn-helix transcriptional regulator [Prevotella lacticifex]|jgi:transcriptional regulator with XRE-family HTH domain|uniref:Transcriptional regulator n=1 Tax=Prevotella lacticifex TaxID=2854755 RepID=A0A9R1CYX6_9BACT|nr:helix-turn-helix transcriptional regulator [Prevotella lacticifex]GJG35015.1 transcriptional regulator [Prevotella lacticifex]GJG39934.1 transcriptional regulator [Prevotella lacticifex]GJG41384.1 transcriptional regulator [Prevotella lacticifex]GJG46287.1 transcriptional regulator [Prevotella lacticifex]GJG47736.1 transcriptional regulator [Prevotella lacticifex]
MTHLNRLKVVLVEREKTGKWLADQLGKSTCTVSKWCKNTVQPDLITLDKISKLLNVSIKDLLVDNRESQIKE